MRSRAIATGLATVGLFANGAPALGSSGGIGPEGAGSGGVGPEKPAASSAGMGGISSEDSSLAAKIRFLKGHERSGKGFKFLGLDPQACDPDAKNGSALEVEDEDGMEAVNTLVILKPDASGVAYYVGRLSRTALVLIPAEEAQVTAYPGYGDSSSPVPVENPEDCIAPHTFHATSNRHGGIPSFRAENGETFGVVLNMNQDQ